MSRRRLLAIVIGGTVLLVAAFVGVVLATSGSSSDELVLYSARSHYGEEKPFEDFAKQEGIDLTIRGSTERVGPNDVTTYEGLGDPRWKGRLCLRSGTSEYNVSFVADRLAKDGRPATERMLRRWMANDPDILGSDTDVLNAIADGDCDVGLTNSYYLGRELEEDPDFPVALEWADQQGRGTHVNLSGLGVVRGSDQREAGRRLIEFLLDPRQQEVFAQNNHEFPVVEGARPSPEVAQFGDFKRDPIDVDGAGARLTDALNLMDEVGWD